MSDLDRLYQSVILDHDKAPRNAGRLEHPTHAAEGYNPLCGDRVHVTLEVADGAIRAVRFDAKCCAIARASASMMTTALAGKTPDEAAALAVQLEAMLRGGGELEGELGALAGVKRFPSRIRCATLAWTAAVDALKGTP